MNCDLVINNAFVVTPNGVIEGGVGIAAGQIIAVGPQSTLPEGKHIIDLDGKVLFPGLIDPHTHLGMGGEKFSDETMIADFEIDTKDCLIGGVTTIGSTTLIGRESLVSYLDRAINCGTGHSWCNFKFTSCLNTHEQIGEIPAAVKKGSVSFKFFTGYVGRQAELFGMNPEGISPALFYAACKEISDAGPPAFPMIHAEDPYVRGVLVDRMRRIGRTDYLTAWAETTPEWAESLQIYTYGLIAKEFHLPLYPVHVSCGYTVDTVKRLRDEGFPLVVETVSTYLSTTAEEMDRKGMAAKAKIQPPIRHAADRERLWRGLKEGTVNVVGTDSLTYSSQFKKQDFWECRVGLNLQLSDMLPLVFDEGINRRRLDFVTLAKVLSENIARLWGIYPKKGAIVAGADADLVVVDPNKEASLGTSRYRGRTDYSMWEGRRVRGMPVMTFLRGELVAKDGEIVADKMLGEHISGSSPQAA
jgi:dihydropyrimidinase